MNGEVTTNRGKVLAIGKFKLQSSPDFDFVIPAFSFIVIKESSGHYVSTCINIQMDGYGKTQRDAILDMLDSVKTFVVTNFTDPLCKEQAWESLEDAMHDSTHNATELWDAYHKVQIRLSKQGIHTDEMSRLWDLIKRLQKSNEELHESVEQLKAGIADQSVDIGYFDNKTAA